MAEAREVDMYELLSTGAVEMMGVTEARGVNTYRRVRGDIKESKKGYD